MREGFTHGTGPRRYNIGPYSPFALQLERSFAIKTIDRFIGSEIAEDQKNAGDVGSMDYSEEKRPWLIFRDGWVDITGVGNMPESFIGSFATKYYVASINPNGTANVKIVLKNTTDIASLNHLPWGGQGSGAAEGYEMLANRIFGSFKSESQTITLMQTVDLDEG